MYAFTLKKDQQLHSKGFTKHLAAAPQLTSVTADYIYIDSGGEVDALCQPDPNAPPVILPVTIEQLQKHPQFPSYLGRSQHSDPNDPTVLLHHQTTALRQRFPNSQHFRLAVMNGFGHALGDTLIGVSAFQHVMAVLQAHLPSVSITIIQHLKAGDSVRRLQADLPFVDHVHTGSLPLADFCEFHGYFNFTGLISLPGYRERPPTDFILWWCGLDPSSIPPTQKRNRLPVDNAAQQSVLHAIQRHYGAAQQQTTTRRIFFGYTASVPLRSIPHHHAARLIAEMLASDTQLTLIIDRPLPLEHPRLWRAEALLDSPEKLVAMIANVDGVINVDSYGQHVADAMNQPTVLISTTLSRHHFPYYPNMVVQELPGARTLPGWGKVKLHDQEWQACESAYENAWQAMSGCSVLDSLNSAEHAAQSAPPAHWIALRSPAPPLSPPANHQAGIVGRAVIPPRWRAHHQRLITLLTGLVTPGAHAVQVGCWTGELTLRLAEHLGPQGQLQAIEPRLSAFMLLASYIQQQAAYQITPYHAFPSAQPRVQLPRLNPYAESSPLEFGNSQRTTPVMGLTLDSLTHPLCQLVVIMPPLSPQRVLATAEQLLQRPRPVVVLGPYSAEVLKKQLAALHQADYRYWASMDPIDQRWCLVALPAERPAALPEHFQAVDTQLTARP